MNNFNTYRLLTLLMSILFVSSFSQAQNGMIHIPLDKQVELSNQIVEGKVLSKESFWDVSHKNIYTRQIIEVYKVFKGKTFSTIEVITKGGIVDLEAEVVSHSLHLRKGDIGIFLLQNVSNSNTEVFTSVNNAQGFYKYDLKKNKSANVFESYSDIANNFYGKISQYSKSTPIEVKSFNVAEASTASSKASSSRTSLAPAITTFSATSYTAGTKSVLTINGNGFGNTKGTVGFSDANYGGYLHTDALDNQIISWTDTKIEVEIPDRAGTGTVEINTVANGTITSTEIVEIDFAQINLEYDLGSGDMAYQTQHIDSNNNGGYTWTMNQGFYNSNAKDAFTSAFESWTCSTGINWEISSSTTSISKNADDDVNVISFDPNMAGSNLAQCYSRYSGCYQDGEIKWYITEMDIVFNPNINWNYSANSPAYNQVDFQSVTVHELGHGHQLGHVVNTNEVMHYSLASGKMLRTLSDNDLMGANDVQSRSTGTPVCSQLTMTQSSCFMAKLSIEDEQLKNDLKLFPNPANETLYVKNYGHQNIKVIQIYNVLGTEVYRSINNNSSSTLQLDVSQYARGMYLIKLTSDYGSTTKKLVVN